jgi:hypothetical protein
MPISKRLTGVFSFLAVLVLCTAVGLLTLAIAKRNREAEQRCGTKQHVTSAQSIKVKRTPCECEHQGMFKGCEYALSADVQIKNRCPSKESHVYSVICKVWVSPVSVGFNAYVSTKFPLKTISKSGTVRVQLKDRVKLPIGTTKVGIKDCTVYSKIVEPEPENSVPVGE